MYIDFEFIKYGFYNTAALREKLEKLLIFR